MIGKFPWVKNKKSTTEGFCEALGKNWGIHYENFD